MDNFSKKFEQDGGSLYKLTLEDNDKQLEGGGKKVSKIRKLEKNFYSIRINVFEKFQIKN